MLKIFTNSRIVVNSSNDEIRDKDIEEILGKIKHGVRVVGKPKPIFEKSTSDYIIFLLNLTSTCYQLRK